MDRKQFAKYLKNEKNVKNVKNNKINKKKQNKKIKKKKDGKSVQKWRNKLREKRKFKKRKSKSICIGYEMRIKINHINDTNDIEIKGNENGDKIKNNKYKKKQKRISHRSSITMNGVDFEAYFGQLFAGLSQWIFIYFFYLIVCTFFFL